MNEPLTVRDRIKAVQLQLRDGNISPQLARDSLVSLTALFGNVTEEQRAADLAYKTVLLTAYQSEETANRAKIRAECSPEYMRAREAKDTRDLVVEMIRSCKVYLRSLDEEMRLAR